MSAAIVSAVREFAAATRDTETHFARFPRDADTPERQADWRRALARLDRAKARLLYLAEVERLAAEVEA